jgi:DNA-binding Xre family transcriptional regulator
MAAAQRGIWRSSDLRRLLAEAGLVLSSGKMSYLWSGTPISIRLDDLQVICSVLDCEPSELLVRDLPVVVTTTATAQAHGSGKSGIRPSPRRGARSAPPV